jgi:LPXTG-motif cell wall-anchored protein
MEKEEIMLRKLIILAAVLVAPLAVSSPALAQEDQGTEVSGTARLTLNGAAPENVSFWVESNVPGVEGVICTTDAAMVASGIPECQDGGAVNELALTAPAGSAVDYRVIGSQGSELSQEVAAQGSMVAEEGFVMDASYTFSGDVIGGDLEGTGPEAGVVIPEDGGAAHTQYGDETAQSTDSIGNGGGVQASTASSGDPTGGTGVLPDTGGSSAPLLAVAVLLLAAGSFLAYRSAL